MPTEPSAPLPTEVRVTPAIALPPGFAFVTQEQLPVGQRLGLRNRNSRITLGGQTGTEYFRPGFTTYEAKDVIVTEITSRTSLAGR